MKAVEWPVLFPLQIHTFSDLAKVKVQHYGAVVSLHVLNVGSLQLPEVPHSSYSSRNIT